MPLSATAIDRSVLVVELSLPLSAVFVELFDESLPLPFDWLWSLPLSAIPSEAFVVELSLPLSATFVLVELFDESLPLPLDWL